MKRLVVIAFLFTGTPAAGFTIARSKLAVEHIPTAGWNTPGPRQCCGLYLDVISVGVCPARVEFRVRLILVILSASCAVCRMSAES